MPSIKATPAAVDANAYPTLAEVNTYFDERLALPTPWVASGDDAIRAILQATRVMDSMAQPIRTLMGEGDAAYYRIGRKWTGTPSTVTQRLAWPRIGMIDRNGNAIPSGEIPYILKDAVSELAGQLRMTDSTLNNDVIAQGLKSLGVGSVSLSFKDSFTKMTVPDAVLAMLPPSWYTEETIESASGGAEFEIV